jgi:hypothetical protein
MIRKIKAKPGVGNMKAMDDERLRNAGVVSEKIF